MNKETLALIHRNDLFTAEIPTKNFTVIEYDHLRVNIAVSPRDYYVITSKNKCVSKHINNDGANYILYWIWLDKCGVYTRLGVVSILKSDFETKGSSHFSKDWKFSEEQMKEAIEAKWSITFLSGVTEKCRADSERFLSIVKSATKL